MPREGHVCICIWPSRLGFAVLNDSMSPNARSMEIRQMPREGHVCICIWPSRLGFAVLNDSMSPNARSMEIRQRPFLYPGLKVPIPLKSHHFLMNL